MKDIYAIMNKDEVRRMSVPIENVINLLKFIKEEGFEVGRLTECEEANIKLIEINDYIDNVIKRLSEVE